MTLEFWNLITLIVTAVIILWYTWETKKLREEAQRTNKLSFRPVVVPKYLSSVSNDSRHMKIMNIGRGPALNIECRISQIHPNGGYTNLRDIAANEKFNNLSPDESQNLRGITTIDLYTQAKASEFKNGVQDKFAIIFTYEDIAKFPYNTVTLIEASDGNPVIKNTITNEYDTGNLASII